MTAGETHNRAFATLTSSSNPRSSFFLEFCIRLTAASIANRLESSFLRDAW